MGIFRNIMDLFSNGQPKQESIKPIIPKRPDIVPKTAQEANKSHNEYLGVLAKDCGDVLVGCEFFATMQLRTPLWILKKDGEQWHNGNPPEVGEPWMGIWVPKVKTWKELGFKGIKEFPESDVASDIGPVNHKKYLKFLIEIRAAAENNVDSKSKISALKAVMRKKQYLDFIGRHGGKDIILGYFSKDI